VTFFGRAGERVELEWGFGCELTQATGVRVELTEVGGPDVLLESEAEIYDVEAGAVRCRIDVAEAGLRPGRYYVEFLADIGGRVRRSGVVLCVLEGAA
jgi:hypothetical protein